MRLYKDLAKQEGISELEFWLNCLAPTQSFSVTTYIRKGFKSWLRNIVRDKLHTNTGAHLPPPTTMTPPMNGITALFLIN